MAVSIGLAKIGLVAFGAGWDMPRGMEAQAGSTGFTDNRSGPGNLAGIPGRAFLDVVFELEHLQAGAVGDQ